MGKFGRFKAAAVHLACSAAVLLLCAAVVFCGWYDWPVGSATGVESIFLMLLAIDLVLGPAVMWMIFDPRKKELKRDIVIVICLQAAALVYGMNALFSARPAYIVFAVDRFEIVHAGELSQDRLAAAEPAYRELPVWRPQWISALRPEDPEERKKLMIGALSGDGDLHQLPRFYASYDRARNLSRSKAQDLSLLSTFNPEKSALVAATLAKHASHEGGVGYLPLKGRTQDLSVVVARSTGDVLEIVRLRPWND